MHASPRFFGRELGMSAEQVYNIWEKLGLIEKHFDGREYQGYLSFTWGKVSRVIFIKSLFFMCWLVETRIRSSRYRLFSGQS